MTQNVGEINVKVVSIVPITRFAGEAIRTHFDPRFVVALLLDDSVQGFAIKGTDISVPSYPIAFFAIHSVAQLFKTANSDIVGETYRLRITIDTVDGKKRYRLERI